MALEKISLEDTKVKNTNGVKKAPKIPTIKINRKFVAPLLFVVVIAGGATLGFSLGKTRAGAGSQMEATDIAGSPESSDDIKAGMTFGATDADTFRDDAVGVLVEGGIEGDGSHHLARPFQDPVYLTSSIIDLDLFIGHKITVWGETNDARYAGWLMDVGRIKVEELNAELPEE